jgi:hypothetical protein
MIENSGESGILKVGATNVRDMGNATNVPLADDTSRMEMRLFRERRRVLEYLCQHFPTVRSHKIPDDEQPYSFPRI